MTTVEQSTPNVRQTPLEDDRDLLNVYDLRSLFQKVNIRSHNSSLKIFRKYLCLFDSSLGLAQLGG